MGEFRHLPIVDERGALIGVVSDRDLLGVGMLKRNEALHVIAALTDPGVIARLLEPVGLEGRVQPRAPPSPVTN
jgi:CBS domain-containing protein